jgi:hypothetical protein
MRREVNAKLIKTANQNSSSKQLIKTAHQSSSSKQLIKTACRNGLSKQRVIIGLHRLPHPLFC